MKTPQTGYIVTPKETTLNKTKHIVCYSGGHSSALVAIEVVRKYGKENVILLNHDINPRFENNDIKRFKKEVSDYFLQNIKGKVVTISYFTLNTRLFRGGTYQIPFVLSMDYTNLDSTDTRESILRNFVHE